MLSCLNFHCLWMALLGVVRTLITVRSARDGLTIMMYCVSKGPPIRTGLTAASMMETSETDRK